MPKDAQYSVTFDDGELKFAPVAGGDTPVVITAAAADVEALETGELDLSVAFMQGRIKAAGDMKTLFELLSRSQALRSR